MTETNFTTDTTHLAAPLAGHVSVDESTPSRLADFYELTKPRMNFLVVITTTVGFYMAATPDTPWLRLVVSMIEL